MKKLIDLLIEYNEKEIDTYLKTNGKLKLINPFIIVEEIKKVHKPQQ